MIYELLEMAPITIELLLIASWRALPLILLALIVDVFFRHRLSSKYHCILWTVVVVRLLLPISPPSSLSINGPIDRLMSSRFSSSDLEPIPHNPLASHKTSIRIDDQPIPEPLYLSLVHDSVVESVSWHWSDAILMIVIGIWFLVSVSLLLRSLIAHLRFAMHLQNCRELNYPHLVDILSRECDAMKLRNRPNLKEVGELSAPAVFGLFRTTICLPAKCIDSLSDQEFRWVLRHELAHIRRRDAWLLSLASIVQSIHWFSPLAWIATSRLRSHVESAADDHALGNSSSDDAIAYGRLLLKYAEQVSSPNGFQAIGLIRFASGNRFRRRIELLTQNRSPSRRWAKWTASIATLTFAIIGLTDAAARPESREQNNQQLSLDLPSQELHTTGYGPTSRHTYDVTEVLSVLRSWDSVNAEKTLLSSIEKDPSARVVSLENNQLIAEVTERQHQLLTNLIEIRRPPVPGQIVVNFRVLYAETGFAIGIDWIAENVEIEHNGPTAVLAARINQDQLLGLLRRSQTSNSADVIFAPKVTVSSGQSVAIDAIDSLPLVTALKAIGDGSMQPIAEVIEDGFRVMLRPKTNDDGSVDLTFDLKSSRIGKTAKAKPPIRFSTDPSPNEKVQLPSVSTTAVSSTLRLASNESLLIAVPELLDDQSKESSPMTMFYILTPCLITEPVL